MALTVAFSPSDAGIHHRSTGGPKPRPGRFAKWSVLAAAAALAVGIAALPASSVAQQRAQPSPGGIGVTPPIPAMPSTAPSKSGAEQQKKDSMPTTASPSDGARHVYPKALKDTVDGHVAKRDFDAAIQALADPIAREPANARLLIARSDVQCARGNGALCLDDANRAIAADANFADAYIHRAAIRLVNLQRPSEAFGDIDTVIRLQPNSPAGYFLKGVAHRLTANYPQAIAEFDRALAKAPQHVVSHENKGHTYFAWSKYDEAIASTTAALAIDANRSRALGIRGLAYLAKNNATSARVDLQKALSINGREYFALLGMQALNVGRAIDAYAVAK